MILGERLSKSIKQRYLSTRISCREKYVDKLNNKCEIAFRIKLNFDIWLETDREFAFFIENRTN